jgi:hypothetical protein
VFSIGAVLCSGTYTSPRPPLNRTSRQIYIVIATRCELAATVAIAEDDQAGPGRLTVLEKGRTAEARYRCPPELQTIG